MLTEIDRPGSTISTADNANTELPMLNVLVIAYYFPPMGLSGVQRTLKFVKYLPEFGIRPIVLTAGDTPYYAEDPSLLEEIQPLIDAGKIRVVRTDKSGAPGGKIARRNEKGLLRLPRAQYQQLRTKVIQTFLQPDSRILWKKPALAAATKIIQEERIDACFATAPPFTSFLIAHKLHDLHGIPYLMDYRDAWVENKVLNFYATPFHKAYARKLEDRCVRGSSAITVVNRRMKEVLLECYDFLTHEDVEILPHGYDPEDFARDNAHASPNPEEFRITYAGAFYVGRSPKTFLEGVTLACGKSSEFQQAVRLSFAGVLQKEYQKLIDRFGLRTITTEHGYLPHAKSVELLKESDLLWMTMSDDISAPGKLYEYFGSRKPILGLVPANSYADRILADYDASFTAAPNDAEATANAILQAFGLWQQGVLPKPDAEFVAALDRRKLTERLAQKLIGIAKIEV